MALVTRPSGIGSPRRLCAGLTCVLLLLAIASCSAVTEPRHFGVSRSAQGELSFWFIDCYAPPRSVGLYAIEDEEARALWELEADDPIPNVFPVVLAVGDVPDGYSERVSLTEDVTAEREYEVQFWRGEAYGESLVFRPEEIPVGSVLTFDRQTLTPDEFRAQGCSD